MLISKDVGFLKARKTKKAIFKQRNLVKLMILNSFGEWLGINDRLNKRPAKCKDMTIQWKRFREGFQRE